MLLDSRATQQAIEKMAGELLRQCGRSLVLIGIRARGVPLAKRLAGLIRKKTKRDVPVGLLDITLYRDDLSRLSDHPVVKKTEIPFSIDNTVVSLVDDVLYTGRTIRCALDALFDFGRPRSIKLAVLIDRGGRELPIQADVVGHHYAAKEGENVCVRLKEVDGYDRVELSGTK